MTLEDLTKLIEENEQLANKLNCEITWTFSKQVFGGKIWNDKVSVFHKRYRGEHFHILFAQMQIDFNKHLHIIEKLQKQ